MSTEQSDELFRDCIGGMLCFGHRVWSLPRPGMEDTHRICIACGGQYPIRNEVMNITEDKLYKIIVQDDSKSRKMAPVHAGFFRYFPRAIKACAYLSWMGNQKHNPGNELGWSWNRSNDHGDCVGRHQLDAGTLDEYGLPHELAVAWRAMAQLEKYLVEKYGLELPPAAYMVEDD